jgi:hypothetical protein
MKNKMLFGSFVIFALACALFIGGCKTDSDDTSGDCPFAGNWSAPAGESEDLGPLASVLAAGRKLNIKGNWSFTFESATIQGNTVTIEGKITDLAGGGYKITPDGGKVATSAGDQALEGVLGQMSLSFASITAETTISQSGNSLTIVTTDSPASQIFNGGWTK